MNIRIVLAVVIAIVSVLAGSASQLDTILGHNTALLVIAVCNLSSAVLAAVLGVLSTQSSQANNIINDPAALARVLQSMPGVSKLLVNENATPSLAQAVSTSAKVEAMPGTEKKVAELAKSVS